MRLLLFFLPAVVFAEQFQLFAPTPALTGSGTFTKDFDPAIYGPISRYAVFGATGDAIAYATVSDRHIEIHYSSATSSIGQLPGLPILTVDAPRIGQIPSQPIIEAVDPIDLLTLRVTGANFTASTPVTIDGVPVASVDFANDRQLTVTLAGATELTGKHLHVGPADYFIALPSGTGATQFVPSLASVTAAQFNNHRFTHGQFTQSVALLNPGTSPVTVAVYTSVAALHAQTVTLAAFAMQTVNLDSYSDSPSYWISASAPIRVLSYAHADPLGPSGAQNFADSPVAAANPPAIEIPVSTRSVSWTWQIGSPTPSNTTVNISGNLPFTVSLPTVPWLAVATSSSGFTLLPNPRSLAPGNYTTTVTVSSALPGFTVSPATIQVSLTVSSGPLISAVGTCCAFAEPAFNQPATGPFTLNITSNGAPVDFAASITGADWATVSPTRATTPATLTISAHPEGMSLSQGQHEGTLTIVGSANTITQPIGLMVFGSNNPPPPPVLRAPVSSLTFLLEAGAAAPPNPQVVMLSPAGVTISASSDSPWLTASVGSNAPNPASVAVNAGAVGLTPGIYHGVVTISSDTAGGLQLPVTLSVVAAPTRQTSIIPTPATVNLTGPVNESQSQTVTIESNSPPILLTFNLPVTFAAGWQPTVSVQSAFTTSTSQFVTPATLTVGAFASQPGRYFSSIILTESNGTSITIPVTFTATPSPSTPPLLANLVNSASMLPGALAPREIFSLFGAALGPESQVLVNGSPANVLYSAPGQINAVAPDELGASATVQVDLFGVKSAAWTVPVAKAAPAIFTVSASGVGGAAVLNQDNSVNTASSPATRGTIIQIFTTGGVPEKVSIGGVDAAILFAGAAPEAVVGLFQVNAVVPSSVMPGDAVPLVITIGDAQSPGVTTIAVN